MTTAHTRSAPRPTRVFLVSGHEAVRQGLGDLLEAEPDITVVGAAGSGEQVPTEGPAVRPDVAVLDTQLPDGEAVTLCRAPRSLLPELACLILASFDDDEALLHAVLAGASGCVLRQLRNSTPVSAVRTVANGQSLLDPGAAARRLCHTRSRTATHRPCSAAPPGLSVRERHLLTLMGRGLTDRQIAESGFLAERAVTRQISRVLAELGVGRPLHVFTATAR